MDEVVTIGVDPAKNVFQVHGVDDEGHVVIRRRLRRSRVLPFFKKQPRCLVGMETCATAHHWARQLIELGHEVKLMPPHYVKPYVKRGKNDASDAPAICEAVTRPTMRFVSVKGTEQQSVLMLHRTRELLVRQRTMLVNAIRAHMAELGIVAPVGVPQVKKLLRIIADTDDARLPSLARTCLESLAGQFLSLDMDIYAAEKRIHAWHRSSEVSRRLETIPGIASPAPWRLPSPTPGCSRMAANWPPGSGWCRGNRRQATARQNLQTGRSLSALAAGCRRHVGDPACESAGHEPGMACRHHRPQAGQGRRRGAGQQDRPHSLGRSHARRDLPAGGSIGAWTTDRSSTVWRGEREVMQIRSNRGSGKPVWVRAIPGSNAWKKAHHRRRAGRGSGF